MNKFHLIAVIAAAVAALPFGTRATLAEQPRDHTSVLSVRRMDCPAESAPAVLALSKIPGVKNIAVDYKTSTLKIVPKPNAFPSPIAIWQAAEVAKLEPVRLATAHGVFDSKPRR